MLKMIDLFSGIGGFSLAARWAGIETIQFVEIDPFCRKILSKNFPGVPIHDDVKTYEGKNGTAHIVTAGVPCQPASLAGKRRGKADDRWLWGETLRVFEESGATWGVFENVEGLLTLESGVEFESLLSQMEDKGYETQSYIIPACGVGAPHRRNRIWIIANNGSERAERLSTNDKNPEWGAKSRAEHCGTGQSDYNVANTKKTKCKLAGNSWSRRIGLTDKNSDVTNSKSKRKCIRPQESVDGKIFQTKGWKQGSDYIESQNSNVTNFYSARLAERESQSGNDGKEFETAIRGDWGKSWYEVAASFCTLDDGISRGLVRPKGWRVKALKAIGNSIVPQVAYQLLSGIVEVERQLAEAA